LSAAPGRLDCVYVTASAHDARYTRICVASIRHFYPQVPIKLLAGGPLKSGLRDELARFWNVGMAEVGVGDWGWGFVKLEPLFGPSGERFLVLDSDTVIVGDVLQTWADSAADFLVDDEQQSEADTHRLYYDWRKVRAVDPAAQPPQFVFNTGQWFGTAGVLKRDDFAQLVDWSDMPPRLRHPNLFMPGDQGVLNYVINQKSAFADVPVERRKIMHWPGHGMSGLNAAAVGLRTAPPLVIHWAGVKAPRFSTMLGADILRFFEALYYRKMPLGTLRWVMNGCRHLSAEWRHYLHVRLTLAGS